jgi:hypothetical protein
MEWFVAWLTATSAWMVLSAVWLRERATRRRLQTSLTETMQATSTKYLALVETNAALHKQLVAQQSWIWGHLHGKGTLTLRTDDQDREYFQYVAADAVADDAE